MPEYVPFSKINNIVEINLITKVCEKTRSIHTQIHTKLSIHATDKSRTFFLLLLSIVLLPKSYCQFKMREVLHCKKAKNK